MSVCLSIYNVGSLTVASVAISEKSPHALQIVVFANFIDNYRLENHIFLQYSCEHYKNKWFSNLLSKNYFSFIDFYWNISKNHVNQKWKKRKGQLKPTINMKMRDLYVFSYKTLLKLYFTENSQLKLASIYIVIILRGSPWQCQRVRACASRVGMSRKPLHRVSNVRERGIRN